LQWVDRWRKSATVRDTEKHADFLRDFRGDTIHPSTLELLYELGILDNFLKRPHQEAQEISTQIGSVSLTVADFRHLSTHCKFIAILPQWDFLTFLAEQAAAYPGFTLRMQAEVIGVIEEAERIVGVHATTANGPLEIRADLVVAADGRSSVVREKAGLQIEELGGTHGRPLVSTVPQIRRSRTDHGALRHGPDLHHDQPW